MASHAWVLGAFGRSVLLDKNDVEWVQEQLIENINNASVEAWWNVFLRFANFGFVGNKALLERFHGLRPDLMMQTANEFVFGIEARLNARREESDKLEKQFKADNQKYDKAEKNKKKIILKHYHPIQFQTCPYPCGNAWIF